jgi:hypothetical protein
VAPSNPQKLALTTPTSGGHSVDIIRSRTKTTELKLSFCFFQGYKQFACFWLQAKTSSHLTAGAKYNYTRLEVLLKSDWLLLRDKAWRARNADNLTAVSRLSRKCGILDTKQPYRLPRPVTGIALLFNCFPVRTGTWSQCLPAHFLLKWLQCTTLPHRKTMNHTEWTSWPLNAPEPWRAEDVLRHCYVTWTHCRLYEVTVVLFKWQRP